MNHRGSMDSHQVTNGMYVPYRMSSQSTVRFSLLIRGALFRYATMSRPAMMTNPRGATQDGSAPFLRCLRKNGNIQKSMPTMLLKALPAVCSSLLGGHHEPHIGRRFPE